MDSTPGAPAQNAPLTIKICPEKSNLPVLCVPPIFYRVPYVRSDPERDQAHLYGFRIRKPEMFCRRNVTKIICSCSARLAPPAGTGDMVVPDPYVGREGTRNKKRER